MAPANTNASAIQELLEELHARYRPLRDGAVANYIPELARADPEGFGIALATADGRLYMVGDTEVPFTIQSISKPFAYGLALQLLSEDYMHRKVGVEPSGEAFNAISLDPESGIPRNPMIMPGRSPPPPRSAATLGRRPRRSCWPSSPSWPAGPSASMRPSTPRNGTPAIATGRSAICCAMA